MPTTGVTELLVEVRQGSQEAVDRLLPLVYAELRRLAARQLRRERAGHTLQPTALVHEAYMELVDQENARWEDRAHFLNIAGYLMRQILVRHARRRLAGKREGAHLRVTFEEAVRATAEPDADVIALNEALDALAAKDARMAKVVEMRYFAGLSIEETADVLGVGTATVEREWRTARAWLRRELAGCEAAR